MTNRLYFNAREWSFNKACEKNVGERCFINGIDNKLVEVYTLGNWSYDWTEIMTKPLILEKNTEYSFSFWINGGENDRNNEVCQFRVVFDDDHTDCLIYKLNRGYIKPLKRYEGWELYNITFTTGDNNQTLLKFVAQAAYMSVQPAKEPEAYIDLEDILDQFHDLRPQRHNIIFEDGWPTNTWYATKELRRKYMNGMENGKNFNFDANMGAHIQNGVHGAQGVQGIHGSRGNNGNHGNYDKREFVPNQVMEEIKAHIWDNVMDEFDFDNIVDELKDNIDIKGIMEEIKAEIDLNILREEIKQEILNK